MAERESDCTMTVEADMTDAALPLLASLLTHTQRQVQAHEKLLIRAARQGGVSPEELAEHEQMLREVRGVVEAQRRWLERIGDGGQEL